VTSAAVRVVGFAETPVVYASGLSAYEWAGDVFSRLLANTGLEKAEIDGFCATASLSEADNPFHAAYLAEVLGLELDWLQVSSIGGSSFLGGVGAAMMALRTGQCRIAMVLGADAPSSRNQARFHAYRDEFQAPSGLLRPLGAFGLIQNAYAQRYGDPSAALARLVVNQRQNALANENSCDKLRKPLTEADYLASRTISDPLRLLDAVMYCDGGNAVLLMSEDEASRRGFNLAPRIAGYAERINHRIAEPRPDFLDTGFGVAGPRALAQAGLQPHEVGQLQLYDDFSIALILQLEQIGFCGDGEGPAYVLSRDLSPLGGLPLNTGGGQLSVGQPGLAAGGLTFVEAARQMMGQAGARQSARTSSCLVTGIGGIPYARHWMMSNAMVLVP